MEDQVRLKGDRQGLRLFLAEDAPLEKLLPALEAQLQKGEGFFRGATLMVDVGGRELDKEGVKRLAAVLEKWGVELRAFGTDNPRSRGAIRDAGLRSAPSTTAPTPLAAEVAQRTASGAEALLIARTIRSGQSVRHHSHITVVGDVNPGGEVIAGGDVVVWGRLRGVVHAGAIGEEKAIACALDLAPTQLRIAGLAARAPEEQGPSGAEVAHIEKGHIVVEPWDAFRRG